MNGAGIYAITNTVDGKAYIGSTGGLGTRVRQHRANLRGGHHANRHLQAAWNKHGEDAFEFGVLEYLDRLDELHLAEQFWMDIYREEGKTLYNIERKARKVARGLTEEDLCRARRAGVPLASIHEFIERGGLQ